MLRINTILWSVTSYIIHVDNNTMIMLNIMHYSYTLTKLNISVHEVISNGVIKQWQHIRREIFFFNKTNLT